MPSYSFLPKDNPLGYLYRYESRLDCDYEGGPIKAYIWLKKCPIISLTPKGVWIECWNHGKEKKYVCLTARKKYACETKEQALESFIARKERQILLLKYTLEHVEDALKKAKEATGVDIAYGRFL
jgi:hypothetical protein